MTRVCIFTADVADAWVRRATLLAQVAERTGQHVAAEPCFVGLRQTQPLPERAIAYQPFVARERYTAMRAANALFRLTEARLLPVCAAAPVLRRTAATFIEAILACDPDVVVLDIAWAAEFKRFLAEDFTGMVVLRGAEREGGLSSPAPVESRSDKVSIVLPTHNGSRYIRQSIHSCLDQSHRNLEVIVVDDGSTEDMRSVVDEFSDPRIQFIRKTRNQGLPAALNTGFRAATGDFLTWTSDDNYYAPEAISRLTRFLKRYPHIPFVYASMFIVDAIEGKPLHVRRALPPSDLRHQNGVGACFLYTRELYRAIGDYDAGAPLVEDYDYWLRVSKRFRMQRLLDPLYYYRYHDRSLTAKHGTEDVARRFDVVRQQNGVSVRHRAT